MKRDNKYSHYKQCLYLFERISKSLELSPDPPKKHRYNLKLPMRSNFFTKTVFKLIFTIAILTFLGCGKYPAQNKDVIYTIKKGQHYSNAPHRIVHSKLNYTITFDASAMYAIDSVEQADINKLFGFNSCSALHDYQSARFGWRWYHDSLQIMYYIYDQGERVYGYLTSVPMGTPSEYELVQTDSEYKFKVNGVKFIYKKKWKCKSLYNYHLWPYFGGNVKAPHDIMIKFRRTNEK